MCFDVHSITADVRDGIEQARMTDNCISEIRGAAEKSETVISITLQPRPISRWTTQGESGC